MSITELNLFLALNALNKLLDNKGVTEHNTGPIKIRDLKLYDRVQDVSDKEEGTVINIGPLVIEWDNSGILECGNETTLVLIGRADD